MLEGDEDQRRVVPDGLSIRRRRHQHRWSPRDLVGAIERAHFIATGLRETITPNLLQSIEEKNERIPYATLRLVADGLNCDPVDILAE
ncbi:MAG: hypothetical protein ACJZ7Z_06760 [Myxococcota bacterium]|nr:hypothetical protein [Spirochaeta sp.]RPG06101.1 MAG: hypothetical protein CBC32_012180 [Proteobacteria bacterium TMED72]